MDIIYIFYFQFKILCPVNTTLKHQKNSRTTINGYYIHDCRKAAKYAFEDFLICVKLNEKNHCYDIFIRQTISEGTTIKQLPLSELAKFKKFYPKSFNVILLSNQQFDLLSN